MIGAAGGVGTALVQLGKLAGMTIIGTVSSEEKAEFARSNGADHVIYYRNEDVIARTRELTEGRGVGLILDHVGGPDFVGYIRALGKWGTLVSYNAFAGLPQENLVAAMRDHLDVCPAVRCFSFHVYDHDREGRRALMREVIGALERGAIRPAISARLKLADVRKAHSLLEQGSGVGQDRDDALRQGLDAAGSCNRSNGFRRALPVLRADRGPRATLRQMRGRLKAAISRAMPAALIAVDRPAIAVVASRPRAIRHGQRRPRRIFRRIVVFLRVVALPGVVTLGIGGRAVDIDRLRGVGRSVLAIDRCRCAVCRIHPVRGLPISVIGFRVRPMGRSGTHVDVGGRRVNSAGRHVDG